MPATMPDLQTFKKWAKDCAPAARAVCMAKAYAELTRERVDAYIKPIFDSYGFVYGAKYARSGEAGAPLKTPRDLYLVDDLADPLVLAFYTDCDTAHRANGYKDLPAGHCPALRAEHLLMETERALMDLAKPLFGIDHVYGEDRKKYLDLLIGACLRAEKGNRMITITIKTDNETFSDGNRGAEVARILRKLARYAEQDLDLPNPRDINGNTVGTAVDSEAD